MSAWVRSRHFARLEGCPLSPCKRTLVDGITKFASCQKRKSPRLSAAVQLNPFSITYCPVFRTKKWGDFDLAQIPVASGPGKNKHVLYQTNSSVRREVACDWLHPLDSLLASNRIDGVGSDLIDSFRLSFYGSSYYFRFARFSCRFFCDQRMVSTVDHRNSRYRPQSDRKDRAYSTAYR